MDEVFFLPIIIIISEHFSLQFEDLALCKVWTANVSLNPMLFASFDVVCTSKGS